MRKLSVGIPSGGVEHITTGGTALLPGIVRSLYNSLVKNMAKTFTLVNLLISNLKQT